MLLYASRDAVGSGHFQIRGLLPLRGMLVSAGARQVGSQPLSVPAPRCGCRPWGSPGHTPDHAHQRLQDQARVLQHSTCQPQGALSFGRRAHRKPGPGAGATALLEGWG